MQHMIANAAASIFVGENLVKNEKLIESFKNMTIECGAELRGESLFFEYFSTLNRWRQWYIGKFSKTVQRHRSQLYNALKPEVEERLANCNKPGWKRPVSLNSKQDDRKWFCFNEPLLIIDFLYIREIFCKISLRIRSALPAKTSFYTWPNGSFSLSLHPYTLRARTLLSSCIAFCSTQN